MRIPRIKSLSNDEQVSHGGAAPAHDSKKTDAEHTLVAVSLRIWGTTLFLLTLPVLGIATFHAASTDKGSATVAAELCQSRAGAPATQRVAQDRIQGTD